MSVQSLKAYIRQPLFIIVFTVLSLVLLFYFIQRQTQNITRHPEAKKQASIIKANPVRLKIPKINVDALIEYTGVTATGAMEVPDTAVNVGWFKLGPQPGEKGNAVIAGHFDGKNGEAGVFINLYKLKKGDKMYVEDNKGTSIVFVVREIRIYDPGYANDVFSGSDSAHLNLITCDGVWDGNKKSYNKRLVVFNDIIH